MILWSLGALTRSTQRQAQAVSKAYLENGIDLRLEGELTDHIFMFFCHKEKQMAEIRRRYEPLECLCYRGAHIRTGGVGC